MSKFGGKVGFSIEKEITELNDDGVEIKTGRIEPDIVEKEVYGEILKFSYGVKNNQYPSTNDDLTLSNKFSILGDPFFFENFHLMTYLEWMGTKWKISNVEIQYPRLILSVGEVYNG